MGEKEDGKGFVVRDRRFSAEKEAEKDPNPSKEEDKREEGEKSSRTEEVLFPKIDFTNFLLSLSTSALIQLGEIPDPVSKQSDKQLPLAKQTIDLISMLQEKTQGNLTPDEAKLMEYVLYDLRMRYVKATK